MSYSVNPILSTHINKQGLQQILLQVIYNRVKIYPGTGIKIKPEQWSNGKVVDHPLKKNYNDSIREKKLEAEKILIDLKGTFNTKQLSSIITGEGAGDDLRFSAFAERYKQQMRHKFSSGRIKHYRTIINKVEEFSPGQLLTQINGQWLQLFENWLFDSRLKTSTVKSKIALVKAVIRAAEHEGLMQSNFRGYKNIQVLSEEPEFLNENELQAFFDVARAVKQPSMKLAGYYFLLSCFTGFRLGTALKFNYKTYVREDEIFIRINKNNTQVYIPIYPELAEVLNYIQDKPLDLSETHIRLFVKQIGKLAGISKDLKYHSSRHTAATRFAYKGFSQKEVAEIIGDTEMVTKIYMHLDKKEFKEKFLRLMA